MAKLPKVIKIGCHIYNVARKSKAEMPKMDGQYLDGCCDYDRCFVYLRKGLRISKVKEFLLHELLHACTYPALNGKVLEEEEWVDKTAPALLLLLQDNPELVEYLTK